jgi:RNA polymerase sigma-70 factor (ECF subfamily)
MRDPNPDAAGGSAGDLTRRRDLGETLDAMRPRLTSLALRYAPSRDAAEDIVQNAFEKAVRHLDQFRGRSRLSTWLHRIVVNESLMWLRTERRRALRITEVEDWEEFDRLEGAPDAARALDARERRERLLSGLATLPVEERDVLVRCALGDTSYEQFGAEHGLKPAAVKSRAFRGRRRLHHWLSAMDGAPLRDF